MSSGHMNMILPESGKVLISWTQKSAYSSRRHKVKDAIIGIVTALAAAFFVLSKGDDNSEEDKLRTSTTLTLQSGQTSPYCHADHGCECHASCNAKGLRNDAMTCVLKQQRTLP